MWTVSDTETVVTAGTQGGEASDPEAGRSGTEQHGAASEPLPRTCGDAFVVQDLRPVVAFDLLGHAPCDVGVDVVHPGDRLFSRLDLGRRAQHVGDGVNDPAAADAKFVVGILSQVRRGAGEIRVDLGLESLGRRARPGSTSGPGSVPARRAMSGANPAAAAAAKPRTWPSHDRSTAACAAPTAGQLK
jgi:hypothetical protein